jgi:hypothetical protein
LLGDFPVLVLRKRCFACVDAERFDGADPAGPGVNPGGVVIFRTTTSRFVVRFLDWPGAH